MKVNRQAGIHLHKTKKSREKKIKGTSIHQKSVTYTEYYWILIAKNGKTIARSSETYKRKAGAVKSIIIAANIFCQAEGAVGFNFLDHTKGKVVNDFVPY